MALSTYDCCIGFIDGIPCITSDESIYGQSEFPLIGTYGAIQSWSEAAVNGYRWNGWIAFRDNGKEILQLLHFDADIPLTQHLTGP